MLVANAVPHVFSGAQSLQLMKKIRAAVQAGARLLRRDCRALRSQTPSRSRARWRQSISLQQVKSDCSRRWRVVPQTWTRSLRIAVPQRTTGIVVSAMVALGLLDQEQGRYRNSAAASWRRRRVSRAPSGKWVPPSWENSGFRGRQPTFKQGLKTRLRRMTSAGFAKLWKSRVPKSPQVIDVRSRRPQCRVGHFGELTSSYCCARARRLSPPSSARSGPRTIASR